MLAAKKHARISYNISEKIELLNDLLRVDFRVF